MFLKKNGVSHLTPVSQSVCCAGQVKVLVNQNRFDCTFSNFQEDLVSEVE